MCYKIFYFSVFTEDRGHKFPQHLISKAISRTLTRTGIAAKAQDLAGLVTLDAFGWQPQKYLELNI